MGSRRGAS